jgi:hypothetical protein
MNRNPAKQPTWVPTLEEMREMTDAELLKLRTSLSYDMSQIESQIRFSDGTEEKDEDWERRAAYAQHVRQHGISAIKNILAERTAARSDDPMVPLARWLHTMQIVVDAARSLNDDDSDENWAQLEKALGTYDHFAVRSSVIREVLA